MTLQQFITRYNNQPIDYDGLYGYQCMDLMARYMEEVLEVSGYALAAPTAYEAYVKGHNQFDKFTYDYSGSRPQAGDIVFWDTTVGPAGHVAVCISGGSDEFTSFDQNWPVGSVCHEQRHDYTGVAGWLRHKSLSNTPMTTAEQEAFDALTLRVQDAELRLDKIEKKKTSKKKVKTIVRDQFKSRIKGTKKKLAKILGKQ